MSGQNPSGKLDFGQVPRMSGKDVHNKKKCTGKHAEEVDLKFDDFGDSKAPVVVIPLSLFLVVHFIV